jgi:hypothetical protein
MAKKKQQLEDGTETEVEDVESEMQTNIEPAEKAPVDEPKQPAMEGLVKMAKDGKIIHAHPTAVAEHSKNGWKRT